MRLRLDIAYDGTEFHGWASQPGLRTIQEELEAWLPRLLRLTEPVTLTCAGRTDAGVHARGQVAHVDLPEVTDVERVIAELGYKLRNVLPPDVVVRRVSLAPPGFDARFSAIWRRYAAGPLETGDVPSGHYLAEEAPEAVLARLDGFLSR